MTGCRKTDKNTACGCGGHVSATEAKQEPFEVCLPLGKALAHDGEKFIVKPGQFFPDGVYDEFVVENGCIVTARKKALPQLTPGPCAPLSGGGSSQTGSVEIEPGSGNLLSRSAAGRLQARFSAENTDDILVSGLGTAASPFKLTLKSRPDVTVHLMSGNSALTVQGTGSSTAPFIISHKAASGGTYRGFKFDGTGHFDGYTASENTDLVAVTPGPGLDGETKNGVAVLGLKAVREETRSLPMGVYQMQVDIFGRVLDISRMRDDTPPGTYDPLAYTFTIDNTGFITKLEPITRVAAFNFSTAFAPGRSDTTMSFTPRVVGLLRVSYRGNLGASTEPDGYSPLTGYSLSVDGALIQATQWVVNGMVLGVDALFTPPATAALGEPHTVSLTGPQFNDYAVMDLTLCQV